MDSVIPLPDETPLNAPVDLEEEEEVDVKHKLNILESLFPDAEKNYLVLKAREFALNSDGFEKFVAELLDSRNYPAQPVNSTEPPPPTLHEIIYSKFDLSDFLKKYENPIEYFKEHKTSEDLHNLCLVYLKFKFLKKSVSLLRNYLMNSGFSLLKAFCAVRMVQDDRKSIRSRREVFELQALHVNSSSFADEVITVENLEVIEEFILKRTRSLMKSRKKARLTHALMVCGCCFDDDCVFEEMLNCEDGHLFCFSCVRRSVEVALGDGKVVFPCLSECTSTFHLDTIKKVLHEKATASLLVKLQAKEIQDAGIDGLVNCPFCEYAEIPPEGDRVFHCKKCKKESCIFCKRPSHIPQTCEEAAQNNARLYIEERMSETLIRKCYQCQSSFIKIDGCNKMLCSCKAIMCYICRQPVKNYDHFNNSSTPEAGKCPLYSTNEELHLIAVVEAGEQAKNQVIEENPELAVDYNVRKEFDEWRMRANRGHTHGRHQGDVCSRYNPY